MSLIETNSDYLTTNSDDLDYAAPTEHGVVGRRLLSTLHRVRINIDEVRRERTGVHGRIVFYINEQHCGFDNINLEKGDQRGRFCRDVYKNFDEVVAGQYGQRAIIHDVGILCQAVINWESDHLTVEYVDPDEFATPLSFPIHPFVLDNAGSILFAPPGTGKSYVALIMAMCIANGLTSPFNASRRPVIYVNLERPKNTFLMRDHAVRRALGITGISNVGYMHARGMALKAIIRKLEKITADHPDTVIIMDSISRTGLGSLLDDATANQFTDSMNALNRTWVGIGHTPRGDDKHVFGSVHFTAGCDIETRLVATETGSVTNLLLETVKANDGRRNYKKALSLEFGEPQEGLIGIREIDFNDPELIAQSTDVTMKIANTIEALGGKATPNQIADELAMHASNVTRTLKTPNGKFVLVTTEGRNHYYGIKANPYQ